HAHGHAAVDNNDAWRNRETRIPQKDVPARVSGFESQSIDYTPSAQPSGFLHPGSRPGLPHEGTVRTPRTSSDPTAPCVARHRLSCRRGAPTSPHAPVRLLAPHGLSAQGRRPHGNAAVGATSNPQEVTHGPSQAPLPRLPTT